MTLAVPDIDTQNIAINSTIPIIYSEPADVNDFFADFKF